MVKHLGIISQSYTHPLIKCLKERNDIFDLIADSSAMLAIQLREKKLDGAFLSPIDYAKDYSMYRIVPDIGFVSQGESNIIFLLFKENLMKIETVAINPNFSSEVVLANLILAEKFDTKPKLIPCTGNGIDILSKVDAVLVVGDDSLKVKNYQNKIDLVDEWDDLTGLPFVHSVWVARDNILTSEEIGILISCGSEIDVRNDKNENGIISYKLDEIAIASLSDFFRMAYYHGILNDIPDLKFFEY